MVKTVVLHSHQSAKRPILQKNLRRACNFCQDVLSFGHVNKKKKRKYHQKDPDSQR